MNTQDSGFGEDRYFQPGEVWDRFGSPKNGRHFSPDGTLYAHRSLPPTHLNYGYHRYMWIKEWDEGAGQISIAVTAPAFGQPGGGLLITSERTAMELMNDGYIVEITQ